MSEERAVPAPLKTIAEHNAERRRIHEERNKPRPTGVKCDECGTELVRKARSVWPGLAPYTTPPSKPVWCPHCNWRGSILA